MCGIVAHFRPDRAKVDTQELVKHYIRQQTRGREGFGFSYLTETGKIVTKRFAFEAAAFHELAKVKSWFILLHHRRPTSTANRSYQNQPITVRTAKHTWVLAHNGMITNFRTLREQKYKDVPFETDEQLSEEQKTKKVPASFNDSEVLLRELIEHFEHGKALECEGSVAFVLLQGDKNGVIEKVHFGRNSNPLFHAVYRDGHEALASEVFDMKDEDMVMMHAMLSIDLKKKKLATKRYDCLFPCYTSPVRPSTYQTPAAGSKSGDGSWLEKYSGKRKKYTAKTPRAPLSEQSQKQKEYVTAYKMAEKLLGELDTCGNPKNCAPLVVSETLKDIDEMIILVNNSSFSAYKRPTGRAEELVTKLTEQRRRFIEASPEAPKPTLGRRILDVVGGIVNGPQDEDEEPMAAQTSFEPIVRDVTPIAPITIQKPGGEIIVRRSKGEEKLLKDIEKEIDAVIK